MEVDLSCLCLLREKTLFSGSCLRWFLATFLTAQEIKYLIGELFSRIKKNPDVLAYVQYLIKFNQVEKQVFSLCNIGTHFS